MSDSIVVPAAPATGIGALYAALSKAQGVMGAATKGRQNPFFKSRYATLTDCWNVCREPLADNGLSVIQFPTGNTPEGVTLRTILAHEGGASIESEFLMPVVKRDPQGVGSAISYARRYALSAILGIVSDEDDDGNAASGKTGFNGHGHEDRQPPKSSASAVNDRIKPPASLPRQDADAALRTDVLASFAEFGTKATAAEFAAVKTKAGVVGKTPPQLTTLDIKAINDALPPPFKIVF